MPAAKRATRPAAPASALDAETLVVTNSAATQPRRAASVAQVSAPLSRGRVRPPASLSTTRGGGSAGATATSLGARATSARRRACTPQPAFKLATDEVGPSDARRVLDIRVRPPPLLPGEDEEEHDDILIMLRDGIYLENLSVVAQSEPAATVDTLYLRRNRLCTISGPEFWSFASLWSLDLSHNAIADVRGLGVFMALGYLDLRHNSLETSALQPLAGVEILRLRVREGNQEILSHPDSFGLLASILRKTWMVDGRLVTEKMREEADRKHGEDVPRGRVVGTHYRPARCGGAGGGGVGGVGGATVSGSTSASVGSNALGTAGLAKGLKGARISAWGRRILALRAHSAHHSSLAFAAEAARKQLRGNSAAGSSSGETWLGKMSMNLHLPRSGVGLDDHSASSYSGAPGSDGNWNNASGADDAQGTLELVRVRILALDLWRTTILSINIPNAAVSVPASAPLSPRQRADRILSRHGIISPERSEFDPRDADEESSDVEVDRAEDGDGAIASEAKDHHEDAISEDNGLTRILARCNLPEWACIPRLPSRCTVALLLAGCLLHLCPSLCPPMQAPLPFVPADLVHAANMFLPTQTAAELGPVLYACSKPWPDSAKEEFRDWICAALAVLTSSLALEIGGDPSWSSILPHLLHLCDQAHTRPPTSSSNSASCSPTTQECVQVLVKQTTLLLFSKPGKVTRRCARYVDTELMVEKSLELPNRERPTWIEGEVGLLEMRIIAAQRILDSLQ